MKKLIGTGHKLADNIDTDLIIPARYLNTTDAQELASHCLEGLGPDYPDKIKPGDIIIAGKNFGCGSSREHAPLAIKSLGVGCVIAASFARIFYRNGFNLGLPLLECPDAAAACKEGDRLEVDLETGLIINRRTGERFSSQPIPPFMLELVADGGLMAHLAKQLKQAGDER
jgi:3-isopropylmalate dehydratase small subunit